MKNLGIFFFFFFFFVPLFISITEAQLPSNTTGYGCNATSSAQYPCQAYLLYRAHSPNFLDLANVSDLFSLSRLAISVPSNISDLSAPLSPNQPLFVPVSCSCNSVNRSTSLSYANISHTIKSQDTFYRLSKEQFQNLTTWQSVVLVNPSLVPTNLSIGDSAVFPIFCRCPDPAVFPAKYLVSYVYRPSDTIASIAAFFGASVQSILDYNGENPRVSDTVFVPVNRLPNITQPVVVVSPPENDDEKDVVLGLAIGLGFAGFLLILLCVAWLYREKTTTRGRKKYEMGKNSNRVLSEGERNDKYMRDTTKKEMEEGLMADVSGCLDKYKVFGIDEIVEATDGFHENCLVLGSVYRGVIDGQVLAIKKMNWDACEELKILQKVNHGNLVKLEGFCIDPANSECYLIYEFVENGSLDSWLHGGESLSWKTRVRIAVDVANGLQYIHEHTRPRVVHKDIKSSNILLDAKMRAKIANFGLAKSGCNAITTHIVGTQGYIAPEYLRDGVVSTKTDVFSFGVVLLELVSGREVVDEKGRVLWASAAEAIEGISDKRERAKRVMEFVDRSLIEESCSTESLMSVMALALACTHQDPSKRPSMVDIVYALCKSDESFNDFSGDTFSGSEVMAR